MKYAVPHQHKAPRQLETAEGRGVYTSRLWEKAVKYAVPHQLPGSNLLAWVVFLVVVPTEPTDQRTN